VAEGVLLEGVQPEGIGEPVVGGIADAGRPVVDVGAGFCRRWAGRDESESHSRERKQASHPVSPKWAWPAPRMLPLR
jgi:hypothetical protein